MNTTAHPATPSKQPLEEYVERLIEEKQYPTAEPAILAQMKKDLMGRLQDTIVAKVIAELPEQDLEAFQKLLDQGASAETIQAFVEQKIPNGSSFIANILLDFRKTFLGLA